MPHFDAPAGTLAGAWSKTMKITIREEGKYTAPGEGVGVFFEDLNYDLDGGLYAEMLENANFEAKDVHGEWDHYIV